MTAKTTAEFIEKVAEHEPLAVEPAAVETDGAEEAPVELEKDVLFDILKNQRRRDALAFLRETDGQTTLSDMAGHIAAKENDTTVQQLSSSQRKRVYIGLYQCHLPKMDAAGVVDFDKNRGTIRLLDAADQLEPFLGGEPARARPDRRALAAAAVIGLGTAAGVLGVPGFTAVPDAAWAILSATALVVLAAVEARFGADRSAATADEDGT